MDIKNVNKSKEMYKKPLTTGMLLTPVDIGTRLEIPVVNLTIRNPRGVFDVVGNSRGIERETGNSIKTVINGLISILECKFILKNGIDTEIDSLFELHSQRARSILCLSCSLSTPDILFSPLVYSFTSSIIEETPHRIKCYPAKKLGLNKMEIEIDEAKILNIIEKILKYQTFIPSEKSVIKPNIIESMNNYQLALISTNSFSRYVSLYQSFEKAVNADVKDQKKKKGDCDCQKNKTNDNNFDSHVIELLNNQEFNETEIGELRTFDNRIKHAFRNEKDITTMEDRIKDFSKLLKRLKKVTDNIIIKRIT